METVTRGGELPGVAGEFSSLFQMESNVVVFSFHHRCSFTAYPFHSERGEEESSVDRSRRHYVRRTQWASQTWMDRRLLLGLHRKSVRPRSTLPAHLLVVTFRAQLASYKGEVNLTRPAAFVHPSIRSSGKKQRAIKLGSHD